MGFTSPRNSANLIPVDEWVKREDPTTAQTVSTCNPIFGMLEIVQRRPTGRIQFRGRTESLPPNTARASAARTRHEAI